MSASAAESLRRRWSTGALRTKSPGIFVWIDEIPYKNLLKTSEKLDLPFVISQKEFLEKLYFNLSENLQNVNKQLLVEYLEL